MYFSAGFFFLNVAYGDFVIEAAETLINKSSTNCVADIDVVSPVRHMHTLVSRERRFA